MLMRETTEGKNVIASETVPDGFEQRSIDSSDENLDKRIRHDVKMGSFLNYWILGSKG